VTAEFRTKIQKKWLWIAVLIYLFGIAGPALGLNLQAYVDRTVITVGHTVNLTVEIQGSSQVPQIAAPGGDDFVVISGPSRSTSIQIVNGARTASVKLSWALAPRRTGKLTIPAIEYRYKRQTYRTDPIGITVSENPSQSSRPSSPQSLQSEKTDRHPNVFLRAIPNKKEVYKGEEILVSFALYFKENVRNFSRQKLPDAQGFWVEQFPTRKQPQVTTEVIDGEVYRKAELQRLALFPTQTGELLIDPMIVDCELIVQRRQPRSIFDDFFSDSFFGSTKVETVQSEPVTIKVNALPAGGQPTGFTGGVGSYSIRSTIDTLETEANQAITVVYELQGRGNINTVKLPALDLPSSVEQFDPKVERQSEIRAGHVTGLVRYEYVLIPRSVGVLEIPAIQYAYFDPVQQRYHNISSRAFPVQVHPRRTAYAEGQPLRKREISELGSDIRFIHRQVTSWHRIGHSVFASFGFLFSLGLALLIVVGAVLYRYWTEKLETNVAFSRRRRAWSRATAEMERARGALAEDQFTPLLDASHHAVAGFIGNRLTLPNSELGVEQIRTQLRKRKLEDQQIERATDFLQTLERYRFAPDSVSDADLRQIIERADALLAQLHKVI